MRQILRNARLADGRCVDLEITEGVISRITAADDPNVREAEHHAAQPAGRQVDQQTDGVEIVDLQRALVLGAFAEPHAHLDKAFTAELVPNPSGDLDGAIQAWSVAAAAGLFDYANTVTRAVSAMQALVRNGVLHVRTHVNVGACTAASGITAVREAAAMLDGIIDVQTVALTVSPIIGNGAEARANRAALDAAVSAGADLVGGCPHLEPNDKGNKMIDHAIDVATEAGIGIDLHVDETLDSGVFFLPVLARAVMDRGFGHPVAASHCVTLGMQQPSVQTEVAALVAQAGISVFPLPQTNLFLQGRDHRCATPRGITAVDALLEAGAEVAAGGDNVQDPFNPVGRSDPLETASLMIMAGHRLPEVALGMVSNNARRALGVPEVNFEVGDPADFVVINSASAREAIADAPTARTVYRGGNPVAATKVQSWIIGNPPPTQSESSNRQTTP